MPSLFGEAMAVGQLVLAVIVGAWCGGAEAAAAAALGMAIAGLGSAVVMVRRSAVGVWWQGEEEDEAAMLADFRRFLDMQEAEEEEEEARLYYMEWLEAVTEALAEADRAERRRRWADWVRARGG